MYAKLFEQFENAENLGGKAWQHAATLDLITQIKMKDCSLHCFHYQQLFEMLFKYVLETQSKYGLYSRTHKLNRLLEEVIEYTTFRIDKKQYRMALQVITVCAEEYRYNFLIDCEGYRESVEIADHLLRELLDFAHQNVIR
jgi:HEPN domain-containing protein